MTRSNRHPELVSGSIMAAAVRMETWTLKQVQGDGRGVSSTVVLLRRQERWPEIRLRCWWSRNAPACAGAQDALREKRSYAAARILKNSRQSSSGSERIHNVYY